MGAFPSAGESRFANVDLDQDGTHFLAQNETIAGRISFP